VKILEGFEDARAIKLNILGLEAACFAYEVEKVAPRAVLKNEAPRSITFVHLCDEMMVNFL
jgi:hypothetical protein